MESRKQMTSQQSEQGTDGLAREGRASWDADEFFLSRRPELGDTWIVDLAGSSVAEQVCMRTLQGTINRTAARLYLINTDHPEHGRAERFWIDEYARRGWVTIAGHLLYQQAIERFAPEVRGYVHATEAEPWSIHAATVYAMLDTAIVAPDAVHRTLERAGLQKLGDTRGKWADAVSAFSETASAHRNQLAYPGMALVRPREYLWDFVVQQEILPMFSRPKHDSWDGVAAIMDTFPPEHILYGYVSDDTVEEEIAVERASSTGKYLVPTHEVSNLSYHVAVRAKTAVQRVDAPERAEPRPLDPGEVNVAIAITDGDNLQVPIQQYPLSEYWNSEDRGSLPLGWSMGVSLATLAPGIWEFYRSTIREQDEIVSIMGISYVHASTLPDPQAYFRRSFASMRDMGISTMWSLDSSLTITDEPLWDVLEGAPGRESLGGLLVGYGPSIDKAFRRSSGTPVLITQNGYSEDPDRILQRIEELIDLPADQRSPVNFLMATNWNTTAAGFYATLAPLAERGVRFMTPAEALALMPDIPGQARSAVTMAPPPGTCLPSGALEQFGSPILSSPVLAEINNPIPLPLEVAVQGPASSPRGEPVTLEIVVGIDVYALARGFLEERVLPVVEGYGLSEEFAEDAWMKLTASRLQVRVTAGPGAAWGEIREPSADGTEARTETSPKAISIAVADFTADSRVERTPVLVTVGGVLAKTDDAGGTMLVLPETVTFDFSLTVGIGDEAGPLVGGVRGSMTGVGPENLFEITVS